MYTYSCTVTGVLYQRVPQKAGHLHCKHFTELYARSGQCSYTVPIICTIHNAPMLWVGNGPRSEFVALASIETIKILPDWSDVEEGQCT